MVSKKLTYLLIFSSAWAFYIFFSRIILNMGVHPVSLSFKTYIFSLPVLFFFNFNYLKNLKNIKMRGWLFMVLSGAVIALGQIVGNFGLKLSTSLNYGFLIKSTIIFSPLLAFLFLGEGWRKSKTGLIVLFLLGAWLISTQGKMLVPKMGDLLIILSALFIALSTIFQKPALKTGVKPSLVALFRALCAWFVFLLVAPFFDKNFFVLKGWVYLALAGVFYGVMTVFLSKTLKIASVAYASFMSMLTPVLVVILGVVFLKESLTIFHVLGGGLIILSSFVVHKKRI
jgi:drug/metabolite transporter (DMT)-like permease